MTSKTQIVGCLQATECEHCGRKLKYGIQTTTFHSIGADCLHAMIVFDRKRWGNGKPGASYLRDLAMIAERGNRPQFPAAAFVLQLKD